ncbi:MAG: polyprenyl synthetase family protein [Bacteroidales bacterium]|nr:polyprenyl synthetase family protein [Bacteroidales bacterium]MBQ5827704.1 polyprenyl synthetase family protein [Bacteroidales bacterium]
MYTISELDKYVENGLAALNLRIEPKELYEPIEYMISIGGKRLRPELCLLTYNLFSDKIEKPVLYPALALEIFHGFTLIHDDIMDQAELRRGQQTVYRKWNDNIAILSGDVMSIMAYQLLANCPGEVLPQVLALFSKTAAQVCEGQQYDMNFEDIPYITMEDYISMISLKTAVLIACSAKMGALIAGADEKVSQALYDFAFNLGIAFQIQDDLFDTFGQGNVFGKKIGGDILNNKKTWLLVESFKVADNAQKQQLNAIMALTEEQGEEKIARMQQMYTTLGIKEAANKAIMGYFNKAVEIIGKIDFTTAQKEQLMLFADKLVKRIK